MGAKEYLQKCFGPLDDVTLTLADGRVLKGYLTPKKEILGSTYGHVHVHLTKQPGARMPDTATSRFVDDDNIFFGTLFVNTRTIKENWGLFRNALTGQMQETLHITSFFFD